MAEVSYRFTLDTGRVAATAQPIIARKVASVTRRIAAQAKLNAPVRTGNLARSIQEDPIVFQGPFRATSGVTATANYAAAVHDGTRPHVIRARNTEYLRFLGAGRQPVFRKLVHHPGTRPRPFLRNAAEQVMRSENLG